MSVTLHVSIYSYLRLIVTIVMCLWLTSHYSTVQPIAIRGTKITSYMKGVMKHVNSIIATAICSYV